ncbi:MAG: Nif3-like dinuclear metal center hexameric protein [Alistipes sp.]|nr:Nif3-like dinuclear metal center hexameric protein [Alistipes sp.]
MKIREITDCIEAFAPLSLQESYDNAGLIVGRLDDELRGGVLLAVDVTEQVIEEALELGCGMIITHHPIVFSPLKRFNSASVVERCVESAIKHSIALYACHTNLDSVKGGMSWHLGQMLGITDMQTLEPSRTDASVGFGVVGALPEPMGTNSFFALLRTTLGCKAIRHSKVVKDSVQRVAICTGAGGSLIEQAAASGCDIYVTADLKYNQYYLPDGRFTLCDVGHFESEYCAIDLLFNILADFSKKISTFALYKSAKSENPMYYSL